MVYFTSNTYTLKRKILTFTNKISKRLSKPERRFTADISYSMLAAGSCLLTDVVKPNGYKFESLEAMEQGAALFGKATFCMDRGYDDNKMFLKLDALNQDYVIRLKSSRKLLYHNKWTFATELHNRRKGKIKTSVFYKGKNHEAYMSHIKVQITASRKDIYLVLVYGITGHPMMLAANKEIKSKEDVIKVARVYFSRWKIEEYFRLRKLKCMSRPEATAQRNSFQYPSSLWEAGCGNGGRQNPAKNGRY